MLHRASDLRTFVNTAMNQKKIAANFLTCWMTSFLKDCTTELINVVVFYSGRGLAVRIPPSQSKESCHHCYGINAESEVTLRPYTWQLSKKSYWTVLFRSFNYHTNTRMQISERPQSATRWKRVKFVRLYSCQLSLCIDDAHLTSKPLQEQKAPGG
jgi:hypothetical protein